MHIFHRVINIYPRLLTYLDKLSTELLTDFSSYPHSFTQSYPQKDITDCIGLDSGVKWRDVVWVIVPQAIEGS